MVTIVTSLYNIDRQKIDGRSWEVYLEWFRKTLEIKNPAIIFVDSETEEFVKKHRDGLPTLIIVEPLSASPYYNLNSTIDDIMNSPEYSNKVMDTNRIECKSSLYNIVQFSKFWWMKKASEINFFETEFFLWLDAGISRFFDQLHINTDSKYPGQFFKESIKTLGSKIYLQIFMSNYPDLSNAIDLNDSYLRDNRSFVAGGIFMADKKSISILKEKVDDVLEKKMINQKIINNEQIVLGYLTKKNPELFSFFKNYSNIHLNYEILRFIGN